MVTFIEYNEKYKEKIFNFIYNTMQKELNIEKSLLDKITIDLKNINKNYISKNGQMWLAVDNTNDTVIGTISIIENEKGIGELKRFYVEREYRDKKIGYALYTIAEEYSIYKNFNALYLASGAELKKAHEFYEKNGWIKVNKELENVNIFVRAKAYLYKKDLKEEIFNRYEKLLNKVC